MTRSKADRLADVADRYASAPRPFSIGQRVTVAGMVGTVTGLALLCEEAEVTFPEGAEWYCYSELTPVAG